MAPNAFGQGEHVGPPCEDFSRGGEKEMVRHYLKFFSDDCQESAAKCEKQAAWRANRIVKASHKHWVFRSQNKIRHIFRIVDFPPNRTTLSRMQVTIVERNDWIGSFDPKIEPIEVYNVLNERGQRGHLRLSRQYRDQYGTANLQSGQTVIIGETVFGGNWPVLIANAIRILEPTLTQNAT